jgi:hypothetical protein
MAKSTIMGANTSTGIGHNTELNSFLISSPSQRLSRCHREGFRARRSLRSRRHGQAPWPNLETKSSPCQTTSALSPFSGSVYPANGTPYRPVYCQSQSFSASHKSGDLRHRSMLRVGIEIAERAAMQVTDHPCAKQPLVSMIRPGVVAETNGDVPAGTRR